MSHTVSAPSRRLRVRVLGSALLVFGLLGAAPAHAQRPAPPASTTTPLVPWAGTATRRADAMVLRALRRAFPRALTRHDEACPNCELDFGDAPGLPAVRAVDIRARGGPAGVAAIAVFRIAQPPRPHREAEEEGGADRECPDLWVARLSLPAGAREAKIDSAVLLAPDVCFSEYETADDEHTRLMVVVDPETRGLEGPYRVRVSGAPIFHAQQCGCGGVTGAFEAFVRVDGGAPLRVDTHEEQAGCMPVLDGWVAFPDQDHDGDRDLVVRQRWTSPFGPGGGICETSRRVATRAAVDAAFEGDHPECARYVERTVRFWNADAREYGEPQPLPLADDHDAPARIRRHAPEHADGGTRTH